MKAAVLTGIEKIETREQEMPTIRSSTDVLLEVLSVGVCGSDIHYYKTGRIGDQIIKYPFRIGHEFVARVSEVGENVKNVRHGDLVAVDPAISCGQCDQCRNGREHTCRNLAFLGNPDEHEGCLSEYIALPEKCCYTLPENMNINHGVLIEPLSIGNYSVSFISSLNPQNIGILGAGPIGLCVLFNLRPIKPSKVYMTDKLNYRTEIAEQFGAAWAGNPDTIDIVYRIKELEPDLLDVVFECCGQQEAIDQAIEILKPGGHLVIVGIPEIDKINFDIHELRRKEITVHNVRRQNNRMQSTIEFVSKNEDVLNLITHKYNFNEIEKAYELVAGYSDNVIKAVIEMN